MSGCVFVGPTLREGEVTADLCGVVCLPPVAKGDVYRAVLRYRPSALGIIDGFFGGAPSVWHKEILWALSQGVHVFGSASMGALRAAELHTYGMRGVGKIFEAFRDGGLEDDDEVAVVHGPPELGFIAASEPMVNIRATLARAEADGVLSPATRRSLEAIGKSLFFPLRSWTAILEGMVANGVGPGDVEALRAWLPEGQVDQKREDALAMLAAMRETLDRPEPFRAAFRFEPTHFWNELAASVDHDDGARLGEAAGFNTPSAVLEELRLQGPDIYGTLKARALVRRLAQLGAPQAPQSVAPDAVRQRLVRLRSDHGLYSRAALNAWLEQSDLDEAALERLLERDVRAEAAAKLAETTLDIALIDELRLSGSYAALAERARRKRVVLSTPGTDAFSGRERAKDTIEHRAWFFSERLRRPIPDDIAAFARELGFASSDDFDGALLRERIYLRYQLRVSSG